MFTVIRGLIISLCWTVLFLFGFVYVVSVVSSFSFHVLVVVRRHHVTIDRFRLAQFAVESNGAGVEVVRISVVRSDIWREAYGRAVLLEGTVRVNPAPLHGSCWRVEGEGLYLSVI